MVQTEVANCANFELCNSWHATTPSQRGMTHYKAVFDIQALYFAV